MKKDDHTVIPRLILISSLLLTSITLIVLDARGVFNPRIHLSEFTSPVISSVDYIKMMSEENRTRCEEERLVLKRMEVKFNQQSTSEQIKELRGIVNSKFTLPHKIVTARVIERFRFLDGGMILRIDGGTDDGIYEDLPVISSDGLVGITGEVSSSSSYIKPILSPDINVSSVIPERDIRGITRMDINNNKLYLDYVPKQSLIETGDLVFSSGDGGRFPGGILIGRIKEIEYEGGNTFMKCYIEPSVEFDKIQYTGVILINN